METILSCQDLLCKIINHSNDIQDWLCFMTVNKSTLKYVYHKFLLREFMFIEFYRRRLPKCVEKNNRFKMFYVSKYLSDEICLISDERFVSAHSRFSGTIVYRGKGFFLQNLLFEKKFGTFDIDFVKIFTTFTNRYDKSHLIMSEYEYLFDAARKLKYISFHESKKITMKYMMSLYNDYNKLDIESLLAKERCYKDCLKNDIFLYGIKFDDTKQCVFCQMLVVDNTSEIEIHKTKSNLTGHIVDEEILFDVTISCKS